jgi:hypothetical protein
MCSAKQDNRKTNHAMLLPPESAEYCHKNHAYGNDWLYINAYSEYAAGSISIEVTSLMAATVPEGALR